MKKNKFLLSITLLFFLDSSASDFSMENNLLIQEQELGFAFASVAVGTSGVVGAVLGIVSCSKEDRESGSLFKDNLIDKNEKIKVAVFNKNFDSMTAENLIGIRSITAIAALFCYAAYVTSPEFDKEDSMKSIDLLLATGIFTILSGSSNFFHKKHFEYAKNAAQQAPSMNEMNKKISNFKMNNCDTACQFKIKH